MANDPCDPGMDGMGYPEPLSGCERGDEPPAPNETEDSGGRSAGWDAHRGSVGIDPVLGHEFLFGDAALD